MIGSLRKVTYCERYRRANIYTAGCNFRCIGCSYKLRTEEERDALTPEEVMDALKPLNLRRVHFIGGEPTFCPDIEAIAEFCHEKLGIRTKIGHSTGWNLPPDHIDEMHITIKAYSDDLHKEYTGVSNRRVLSNFRKIYSSGVVLSASTVLIPGMIDADEIERIAGFVSDVDPLIPFHITGFIPVPGAPWRSPTQSEISRAKNLAKQHLENVSTSCFESPDDYERMVRENPKYQSIKVL